MSVEQGQRQRKDLPNHPHLVLAAHKRVESVGLIVLRLNLSWVIEFLSPEI